MHTAKVLHKLLSQSVPSIHASRLKSFIATVQSLSHGASATVTSLGRGIFGSVYDKHKIKRVDRLLSNAQLYQERHSIYCALTRRLLQGLSEAIVAIDWSPLCADQSWQLLRAAIPVGGRSLTLYEEVHPQSKLGNRKVQHQFLDQLATLLPANCCPIIVGDAGFRSPFYHYLETQLGWHWVGRIRSRDLIRKSQATKWFSAKSLHPKATKTARLFGLIDWVRNQSFAAFIVLVRPTKKQRKAFNLQGSKRKDKHNLEHAKRQQEPWVLVAALALQNRTPKQIVKIYQTRMQIEEGFRDCKSTHYGLRLSQNRRMTLERRSVLCLIAACAIFVLWCIGIASQKTDWVRQVRVSSSKNRSAYSVIFLARLLISQPHFRLPDRDQVGALDQVKTYMGSVLCD